MIRPNFNLRLSNFIKKWMFHFFFSSDYSVWQHHFRLLEWMKNDAQPCFGQSTIMTLWNAKWLWFKMSDNFGWSSDRQIDISRFSCYIYLHKHCLLTLIKHISLGIYILSNWPNCIIIMNLERVVSIESRESPQCSTNVIGAFQGYTL